MKHLMLFFLLTSLFLTANATCIVIILKDHTFYVAADSRSTIFYVNKEGKPDTMYRSICKIHQFGKVFFTMSGHGDGIIPNMVEETLKNQANARSAYNVFSNSIKSLLEKHFEEMRLKDFRSFMDYKNRGDVCAFSFFGFDPNNLPFMITSYLSIASNPKEKVKINMIQSFQPIIILGFHDHLDVMKKVVPNKMGIVYTAEDAIKYEMKYHKNYIASPIDLLELTNTTTTWVRRKKMCF